MNKLENDKSNFKNSKKLHYSFNKRFLVVTD